MLHRFISYPCIYEVCMSPTRKFSGTVLRTQQCDQNRRRNNLWFLHGTATYVFALWICNKKPKKKFGVCAVYCSHKLDNEGIMIPASFPGLPTIQFWSLAVCKSRGRRPGSFYYMNDVSVYLGRQRGRGPQLKERISCTRSSFLTWSGTFLTSQMFETPVLQAETTR